MAYVAVAKALYDYEAQDPETELAFKEDQILYVIEKEDDDWWKAKLKAETGDEDGQIGLIPATYVEQIPPINTTRAMFAYTATFPEELSMSEEEVLQVYSIEEDWLLVQLDVTHASHTPTLGFVPRTYCEPLDESAEVQVTDADRGEADVQEHRREEKEAEQQRELAEQQRLLKLKDKVETWSISELDGKKKKKGTLGVGNGAVFFASDSDKMGGVKQYNITQLGAVSQPSSKNLSLTFSDLPEPLLFHCGSSDAANAILTKLESSKAAAGEALEMTQATAQASDDEDASEPKTVRWAESTPEATPASTASSSTAMVLYDFDAQGEDELTVKTDEAVTIIDKENDEWWLVQNPSGDQGVVPAQYVQLNDGTALEEDDGRRGQEEAAAAAALEAERQREAANKAEERRAIERAARERQKQEEQDRQYALDVEAKESAKAERRARRQEAEQRTQREQEAASRREAARQLEPPKISKRPSAQDVSEVARSLPSRGRATPARPPENNRPKPTAGRTRVWSDKTGQFKVEAEYLGLVNGKVRLHKLNGVIIEVPLEKMSTEDTQLIKRHESRKSKPVRDDDVPLVRTQQPSQSTETRARAEFEPIPKEAMEAPAPRKPRFDWFAFFLEAGCGIDDCTRYASNFERDNIDEEILEDLDASTLRSLGLKEGDVIRVKKSINNKFAKKTPEQQSQISQDEEYARQLQEHENSGSKGPAPTPPPGLFTGPSGKLANNTRRGRPEKKSTGPVDADALAAASDQLSRVTVSSSSPPAISPPKSPPKTLIAGFDDDAWTIKPTTSKPASPAPPPPAPPRAASPPIANTTESLLAQIQSMRPPSTGIPANHTGNPGIGRSPIQQTQTGSSGFGAQPSYGLGVQNSGQPMSHLVYTARGPLAPVPTNEGLLNPLQPARTGFVPTRSPNGIGMSPQAAGAQPDFGANQQSGFGMTQQVGYGMNNQPPGFASQPDSFGMSMQPTGYAQGFSQGYGGQQPQIQPNFTGFPGNVSQQNPQSSFNSIASIPPPQAPQNIDKFAPSNIFAAMKKPDYAAPEESRPQESNKYDALRPLTTGYNGGPGMMPQQTGMMPGQMGMNQLGMGQQQQQQQMGGIMPQMTGYNPQMGFMGQYGQGYR